MVTLQTPKFAYYNGAVGPWEGAQLHVASEGVLRGLNVFEGLKAYWQPDGRMGVVALHAHFKRLQRSARLLHIPFEHSYEQFENAVHDIIEALCVSDRHIWVRATVYMVEGHWGEDQASDLVLTAYLMPLAGPAPIDIGVSTWQRANDTMLPARIKTSTNYQVARLARIEGRGRGYEEMILLNQFGRVAEAGTSCVLMARDGRLCTPPASEGALESITVEILERMAREVGIPFDRRPIDRTELLLADELALVGTVTEVTPVLHIDGMAPCRGTCLIDAVARRYRDAVTGMIPHDAVELSLRRYTGIRPRSPTIAERA
jgi:branched-chain amino acid aminotransferase